MNTTTKIVFLVFMITLVHTGRDLDLTVTCMGNTVCPSGDAIAVNSSLGYSNNTCVSTGVCKDNTYNNPNVQFTGHVFNCTQDYTGTNCLSDSCFSVDKTTQCYSQTVNCNLNGQGGTALKQKFQTCTECVTITCDIGKTTSTPKGLCINTTMTGDEQPSEACATTTKCLWNTATTTYKTCVSGIFGLSCACCEETTYTGVIDTIGQCSYNTYLNHPIVNDYVHSQWQMTSKVAIILMGIMFMIVAQL